jgi:hypothetical protein
VDFSLNSQKLQLKNRRRNIFRACRRFPRMFSRSESERPTYPLYADKEYLCHIRGWVSYRSPRCIFAEHVIANHGSLLKVHDIPLKSMSLLNISDKVNHWIDSEQNTNISLGICCSLPYYDQKLESLQQAEIAGYRKDFWDTLYETIFQGKYK